MELRVLRVPRVNPKAAAPFRAEMMVPAELPAPFASLRETNRASRDTDRSQYAQLACRLVGGEGSADGGNSSAPASGALVTAIGILAEHAISAFARLPLLFRSPAGDQTVPAVPCLATLGRDRFAPPGDGRGRGDAADILEPGIGGATEMIGLLGPAKNG